MLNTLPSDFLLLVWHLPYKYLLLYNRITHEMSWMMICCLPWSCHALATFAVLGVLLVILSIFSVVIIWYMIGRVWNIRQYYLLKNCCMLVSTAFVLTNTTNLFSSIFLVENVYWIKCHHWERHYSLAVHVLIDIYNCSNSTLNCSYWHLYYSWYSLNIYLFAFLLSRVDAFLLSRADAFLLSPYTIQNGAILRPKFVLSVNWLELLACNVNIKWLHFFQCLNVIRIPKWNELWLGDHVGCYTYSVLRTISDIEISEFSIAKGWLFAGEVFDEFTFTFIRFE